MEATLEVQYLRDVAHRFRGIKSIADRAIEQVSGEELFARIGEESNSIAVLMKHMAGNMLHRWTEPFTTDEERPERNRDAEFVTEAGETKKAVFERWEAGWRTLFNTLGGLRDRDLARTVRIRWRKYTLMEALNRQIVHYSLHAGQIVFLAKHFMGERWRSLSIPKGKSKEFDEMVRKERTGRS
ncbi:MAG: DUF1572 family protein [Candidatus Bathyarchaeota archaeon]|nr:MAG: DUF1572 family protein [Candidatus Bathyarchaeota archaeon]